jgi:hypothetical protein
MAITLNKSLGKKIHSLHGGALFLYLNAELYIPEYNTL